MNWINQTFIIVSILVFCFRDCHNKFFHTYKYKCVYDIKFTKIKNNEKFKIKISDKKTKLNEFKKIKIC